MSGLMLAVGGGLLGTAIIILAGYTWADRTATHEHLEL